MADRMKASSTKRGSKRSFDGKPYALESSHLDGMTAKRIAAQRRGAGHKARVVEGSDRYYVYVR